MPNRMDSMLSHGMGKVKAVKARLKGLTGVFKTLAEQHGEVSVLLGRAKVDYAKFQELWPTIRKELLSHERAEMREVYPVLRRHATTEQLAAHHDAEAKALEALIAQIQELPASGDDHDRLYGQLVKTVLHHAAEEESEIFPKAQDAVGEAEAKALDERFRAAKAQLAQEV